MKIPAALFNSETTDVSRIVAASAIFYYHVGLFTHYPFTACGEYAVEYFVMLSGLSYLLFSRQKPSSPAEYFKYVKRRLAALLPTYLLTNVVLYLASFVYPSHLGKPFSFAEFLASATGVSMYLGWTYMSMVMWFMPFIVQVYLLLPLLDWWAGRTRPVVLMLMAFGVSCLLAQLTPFFFKSDWAVRLVCKNWSPVFRLPEVCAGIIVGRAALMRCGHGPALLAVGVFGILSLSASLFTAAHVGLRIYLPWGGFWVPVLLLASSALVAPLFRAANAKLIRLLGLSSLPFYLFQAAPMRALSSRFGDRIWMWIAYYLVCWLFAIGATLLVANFKNVFKTRLRRNDH